MSVLQVLTVLAVIYLSIGLASMTMVFTMIVANPMRFGFLMSSLGIGQKWLRYTIVLVLVVSFVGWPWVLFAKQGK